LHLAESWLTRRHTLVDGTSLWCGGNLSGTDWFVAHGDLQVRVMGHRVIG
jgi:hypothetical protein